MTIITTLPLPTVCAWCPDFNPRDASNKGVSHTICKTCQARFNADIDRQSDLGRMTT